MIILTYVLTAYLLFTPFLYYKAIQFGMKVSSEPKKAAEEAVFHVPVPKKKPKLTPQEERTLQIIANIDRYSGDSVGQKKVEVKHD